MDRMMKSHVYSFEQIYVLIHNFNNAPVIILWRRCYEWSFLESSVGEPVFPYEAVIRQIRTVCEALSLNTSEQKVLFKRMSWYDLKNIHSVCEALPFMTFIILQYNGIIEVSLTYFFWSLAYLENESIN